jgi:hypothetical protein
VKETVRRTDKQGPTAPRFTLSRPIPWLYFSFEGGMFSTEGERFQLKRERSQLKGMFSTEGGTFSTDVIVTYARLKYIQLIF